MPACAFTPTAKPDYRLTRDFGGRRTDGDNFTMPFRIIEAAPQDYGSRLP